MKNKYSISEFVHTCYSLVLTKITMRKARLIRRPIHMRGKKSIEGGTRLTTGFYCRFDMPGNKKTLFIGDNCEIGDNVHIVAYNNVTIGNNVLMASKIFISDTNHGLYTDKLGEKQSSPEVAPNSRPLITSATKIGSNVWIGENVVILPGSEIGNGCIIGANTVVKGKIDDNCIAVGSPAIVVKKWNESLQVWEKVSHEY